MAELDEEQVVSALEEALPIGVLEEQSAPGSMRLPLRPRLLPPDAVRGNDRAAAAAAAPAGRARRWSGSTPAGWRSTQPSWRSTSPSSTDRDDLAKAVRYGELAAQRALAVYAYGEAVRHLEQALAVQEVLDPDDRAKRCDLLLSLGEALFSAGAMPRVINQVAPQAFELAEALEDGHRAFQVSHLACTALTRYGSFTVSGTPLYQQWAERTDQYATEGTRERVQADVTLAQLRRAEGHLLQGHAFDVRAIKLAREISDAPALFEAADWLLMWHGGAAPPAMLDRDQGLHLAEEFSGAIPMGVPARTGAALLSHGAWVYANAGDRLRADDCWRQLDELAERTRDASTLFSRQMTRIDRAVIDGDLEGAAAIADDLPDYGDELGAGVHARQASEGRGLRARLYLGRAVESFARLREALELAGASADRGLASVRLRTSSALLLAILGRSAEAHALLHEAIGVSGEREASQTSALITVILLETAVRLGDRDSVDRLLPVLAPAASNALCGPALTCAARHLGAAAAQLGQSDLAMRYYEQARDLCGRLRFRPELALTRLGIAELLLEQYPDERAAALEHLEFAIGEFREMKMQPSLEGALRHKEVLKA